MKRRVIRLLGGVRGGGWLVGLMLLEVLCGFWKREMACCLCLGALGYGREERRELACCWIKHDDSFMQALYISFCTLEDQEPPNSRSPSQFRASRNCFRVFFFCVYQTSAG